MDIINTFQTYKLTESKEHETIGIKTKIDHCGNTYLYQVTIALGSRIFKLRRIT